jgi:hypothetical protein
MSKEEAKSPEANQIVQLNSPSPKGVTENSKKLNTKKLLLVGFALSLIVLIVTLPLLLRSNESASFSQENQISKARSENPSVVPISSQAPTEATVSSDGNEFDSLTFDCEDKYDYFQLKKLEGVGCLLRNDSTSSIGIPSDNQFIFRKSAYSDFVKVDLYALFESSSNTCKQFVSSVLCKNGHFPSSYVPSQAPTEYDHKDDVIDYQNEEEGTHP